MGAKWSNINKLIKQSLGQVSNILSKDRKRFMQMAKDLAELALDAGKGGPFGAIVVRGTRSVGNSGNFVFKRAAVFRKAKVTGIGRSPHV
jgi:tRNA(Arg) A34 adenosine deaminase TadA